jgi:ring-1,2-phenylacetyl-CoA epoxidase subunit PaaC
MSDHILNYTLHLADNVLILGHRNSEWTGHGPILEQDIALSNIALDLVGQSRNFYQYAAVLKNEGATEDTLAYLRDADEFKNCLLVEQDNGDWGKTVLRQFLFSVFQYYHFMELQNSMDKAIAGIAQKALKEVTYHVRWSSEWVIRLGDGTEESHGRMKNALDELWQFTDELFTAAQYESEAVTMGVGVNLNLVKPAWDKKVKDILQEATLHFPGEGSNGRKQDPGFGKEGFHTENLNTILAEMQSLQRAYPGCEW